MATIFISLGDETARQKAAEALAAKYEVLDIPPLDRAEGLEKAAERLAELQPEVLVMDYWVEDAQAVKLMQTATDTAERTYFIFVEPSEGLDHEQLTLAFNEGAIAVIPASFTAEALNLYVERALTGPGRLRFKAQRISDPQEDISRLEENLGQLRSRIRGYQNVIKYLMKTPVSEQKRRVLLVSDSPYQLDMLKKILEEHNFVVHACSNPTEAVNLALSEKPRIIVSDLELDGQTGIELCQTLKLTHKFIPCYFIICTANQDKIAKVMTPGNGVDDCILKPSGQSDTVDFISSVALGLLL